MIKVPIIEYYNGLFTNPIFILYASCVMVDVILGNTAAWIKKEVDSNVGLMGTMKHLAVLSFVILFLPSLSHYLGSEALSSSIMLYFVYQYVTSIVENLDKLGFKVPTFFKEHMRRLKEDKEVDLTEYLDVKVKAPTSEVKSLHRRVDKFHYKEDGKDNLKN